MVVNLAFRTGKPASGDNPMRSPSNGPRMTPTAKRPYRGVFPVAPTIFDDRGELDLDGPAALHRFHDRRRLRRPLHPGQFLRAVRADRRRARACDATRSWSTSPAGCRSSSRRRISARASAPSAAAQAQDAGAAMVMVMPPYHGATFRVPERGDLRLLSRRVRRDRHPDHDPGCAGRGHAAFGRPSWPAWRGRSPTSLFQDRGADGGGEAARPDRGRRRRASKGPGTARKRSR